MTAYNIIKTMTKKGNAVIGTGCYAAALSSRVDGNKIIKVGNNVDDPWIDYYELIKENQHNPCVPRIYSFHIDCVNGYYVCVMERLSTDQSNISNNSELCKEYTQKWITREEFVEQASNQPRVFPYPEHLADLLDKISALTEVFGNEDDENVWDDNNSYKRKLDMHSGNFLYRDGAIIVTDPWCEDDMSDISDVSDWWERMLLVP
jgi:hypothetical protein